jgi:hypothetical protein
MAVCYKYFFKGNSVQNQLSNQVFFMKQRHNIFKKRLDPSGKEIAAPKADTINRPKIGKPLQRHGGSLEENEKYCGSCYGAEMSDDQCCNSCEDVREAYRQKGWAIGDPEIIDQCKREGFLQKIKEEDGEGCNVYGHLEVNKVAGNFHFVSVNSFQQVNMLLLGFLEFQMESLNVSHKINELSFGAHFPGVVNPLDGYALLTFVSHIPSLAFQSLFILSALCCWWSRYYPPRASTSQVFYLRPEA